MNNQLNKKLILSLIKDDLINCKLVNGLNALGFDASSYYLHLSETIFTLMGFEDNERSDELYQHYLQLTKRSTFIDISQTHSKLNDLAAEIYLEILDFK